MSDLDCDFFTLQSYLIEIINTPKYSTYSKLISHWFLFGTLTIKISKNYRNE